MILVIDNYDSFTYNLVQYLGELGADVVVRRNDTISVDDVGTLGPSAIVLSPGPGVPEEAGITVDVIRRYGPEIPILGVCLGHQAIGVAYGGKVVGAASLMHGKTSPVTHDGRGIYRGVDNPFVAGRYHSLAVDPASVPDCLEVTARAGDGTIMGLRHRRHPVEGVQFHPESVLTPAGRTILKNFLVGE